MRTEQRPLFGLATTILVGLLLAVPFGIYYVFDTEPYRAIIFPGGGEINTRINGDRATFDMRSVVGFDQEGREVELDIPTCSNRSRPPT